jgi:hypothetical protein
VGHRTLFENIDTKSIREQILIFPSMCRWLVGSERGSRCSREPNRISQKNPPIYPNPVFSLHFSFSLAKPCDRSKSLGPLVTRSYPSPPFPHAGRAAMLFATPLTVDSDSWSCWSLRCHGSPTLMCRHLPPCGGMAACACAASRRPKEEYLLVLLGDPSKRSTSSCYSATTPASPRTAERGTL